MGLDVTTSEAVDWVSPYPNEAADVTRICDLQQQVDALTQATPEKERTPRRPEPSPYEQGFRDALLACRGMVSIHSKDGVSNLAALESELDRRIDASNNDLWNCLAIAQIDLSSHPEADALRRMLRAPNGLLIDSMGRILFIRLLGIEYDTGVLALLR